MLEDIIFEFEQYLKTTQETLNGFEDKIDSLDNSLNPEEFKEFQDLFIDACRSLESILTILNSDSPLGEIAHRLGPTLLGIDSNDFSKLVKAEKKLLRRIGLSDLSIETAIQEMTQLKDKLVLAESILSEKEVIDTIENFKTIICQMSSIGEEYQKAVDLEVIKLCTKGLISVCVVTGDIVSVFTVPDPTPFTFLRSAKSVYSGVKSLNRYTQELKEKLPFLRKKTSIEKKIEFIKSKRLPRLRRFK